MSTWLIRVVFVLLCLLFGGLFWLAGVGVGAWRPLEGSEYIQVLVFAIAIFGALMGVFRLAATPNLSIAVHTTSGPLPLSQQYAVHCLEVWNHDPPWFFRPLFLRTAPEGCQIKFQYRRESNGSQVRESGGAWLHGRWNANPQPLVQEGGAVIANPEAAVSNRRLPKLFTTEKKGHPDAEPFFVSFAIKKQGDSDFYHFNDLSYSYPEMCNPAWRMPQGVYRVEVRITGYAMVAVLAATIRL